MPYLEYNLKRIANPNDFDAYQQELEHAYEHFVFMPESGLLKDAWMQTMNILLPGKAEDDTIAGRFTVVLHAKATEEKGKAFAKAVYNQCVEIFGMDNIFACFCSMDDHFYAEDAADGDDTDEEQLQIICTVYMVPIQKRIPNLAPYADSFKHQPKRKYVKQIEQAVKKVFPDLHTIADDTNLTPQELGYQARLIDFKPHQETKSDIKPLRYTAIDPDSQTQTNLASDQIRKIINDTVAYFTTGPERTSFQLAQTGELSKKKFFKLLEEYLDKNHDELSNIDREFIMKKLDKWAYGFYLLDPLIEDDEVSDIMVINHDRIRVKVRNGRFTANLKFLDKTDYEMFLLGLGARNHLDFTQRAIHVFSDITTSSKFRLRMNIATPHITSDGEPYFHIRKIAKQKRDFDYLLDAGMLDKTIMNYLIDRARYGPGLVFCGKGASGKTTMMNALLDKIAYNKSVLVTQESEELFSNVHPHIMFEHITMSCPDPNQRYDLSHLARNGLLTDLDYFVIGEIKGGEAADFMMAADTGHQCWCSVHAPSAKEGISKLADYVCSATTYSLDQATKLLRSLGTVVFMKNFRVCEIVEISGWDDEKKELMYTPVYLQPGIPHPDFEDLLKQHAV